MELSTLYIVSGFAGGLGLLVVLYLIGRVRSWPYPVRTTEFKIERREGVAERAAERGPSGAEEGDVEAEAVEREDLSLWERMKLELYTYQKRPKKVR